MCNGPYRHSVWIDVFGVLFFGSMLLGGAGYVLSHVHTEGAASRLSVQRSQDAVGTFGTYERRAFRSSRRSTTPSRDRTGRRYLLNSRSGSPPSNRTVPFSESWRHDATPNLTEPHTSSRKKFIGGVGSWSEDGPVSSPRSSSRFGNATSQKGEFTSSTSSAGSDWQAAAHRLAGRTRALNNQIRQLEKGSGSHGENPPESNRATKSASSADVRTSDRDVPDPPNVPIDDQLHWLLIGGVLWGTWRIWRGL